MVRRIAGMMQVVVRGAVQQLAPEAREGDGHVAVPHMVEGDQVQGHQQGLHRQRLALRGITEEEGGQAIDRAGGRPVDHGEHQELHRMLAPFRGRGHHLRGVVHLVEGPQDRDTVHGPVRQPVARIQRRKGRQAAPGDD